MTTSTPKPTSIHSSTRESASLPPEPCVLCAGIRVRACPGADGFFHCGECDTRFLHSSLRLIASEEEARYRSHKNDLDDLGYRTFLRPLVDALLPHLAKNAHGLDFGCGPGPLLAQMFQAEGMKMVTYDPVFQPAPPNEATRFDFITLSEVAEHLFTPRAEFERLATWLKPGGWLGVMTALTDTVNFATWYYRRDPTHVVFYSRQSFEWLAKKMGFGAPEFHSERVILLHKHLC